MAFFQNECAAGERVDVTALLFINKTENLAIEIIHQ